MKETHNKALIIAGAIGATPVILIALAYTGLVLFVVSGAFAIFMPEPAEPLIKYGEFPFSITYEMNNEVITYEDVTPSHAQAIRIRKMSLKKLLTFDYIDKILLEEKGNQHEKISFNKSKIISVLPFSLVKRDKRYIEQYIIEAIKNYKNNEN